MASKSPRKNVKSPKTPKTPPKKGNVSNSPRPRKSPASTHFSDVARRCRDCCASWHELTNKWTGLNELGTSVANKLVNLQLQKQFSKNDTATDLTVPGDPSQASSSNLEEEIVKAYQELQNVHQSLGALYRKMENLKSSFEAIRDLRSLNSTEGRPGARSDPIFHTWTADQFCVTSEKLLRMYEKELALKEKLIPEFIRSEDRQALLVFVSTWLHEPYLEDCYQMLLDSMLIETELK